MRWRLWAQAPAFAHGACRAQGRLQRQPSHRLQGKVTPPLRRRHAWKTPRPGRQRRRSHLRWRSPCGLSQQRQRQRHEDQGGPPPGAHRHSPPQPPSSPRPCPAALTSGHGVVWPQAADRWPRGRADRRCPRAATATATALDPWSRCTAGTAAAAAAAARPGVVVLGPGAAGAFAAAAGRVARCGRTMAADARRRGGGVTRAPLSTRGHSPCGVAAAAAANGTGATAAAAAAAARNAARPAANPSAVGTSGTVATGMTATATVARCGSRSGRRHRCSRAAAASQALGHSSRSTSPSLAAIWLTSGSSRCSRSRSPPALGPPRRPGRSSRNRSSSSPRSPPAAPG